MASEPADVGSPAAPVLKDGRPWRVAMVVASPFPANHGTPGSIREMCEALADLGHEVHVVTYHFGEEKPPRGVTVHRAPGLGLRGRMVVGPTWQKPVWDLLMVFTLARVVWRERIDVIHAHNYEGGLVGFAGRLVTGRPLVYAAVNTMIDELGSYSFIRPRWMADALARMLDWVVPRLPSAIIALSTELERFLEARGIRPERIHVIPLGIDVRAFEGADGEAVRRRLGVGQAPLVLYTGILDRLQRVDYLLRAMTVVAAAVPEARLVLVANVLQTEDLARCRALAEELGLADRVTFVGSESFADIPPYMAASDVTVVPRPHCPGFPVKLLNSLAAGRPVVVFQGSAKGLPDGEAALVVPDHDWQAMGEAIVRVLKDESLSRRLSEGARRWVDHHYAWPLLAERTIDVYRRIAPRA
jgi:glycosyltransferase involved in cell wall biosynthesis